jgi:hypothetical protein
MSKRTWLVLLSVIVLAVAVTAWGGRRWLVDRLMALHGHAVHD